VLTTYQDDRETCIMDAAAAAPSRASFMGIAAELRLKIYKDLLIPDPSRTPHMGYSCESCRRKDRFSPVCATMNQGVHPNILFTCRLVFNEAISILYENMVLRVVKNYDESLCSPNFKHNIDMEDFIMLHRSDLHGINSAFRPQHFVYSFGSLSRLPSYATQYISRVALVVQTEAVMWDGYCFTIRYTTWFLSRLTLELPNLRHLTICVLLDDSEFEKLANSEVFEVIAKNSAISTLHLDLKVKWSIPILCLPKVQLRTQLDHISKLMKPRGKKVTASLAIVKVREEQSEDEDSEDGYGEGEDGEGEDSEDEDSEDEDEDEDSEDAGMYWDEEES
jgi:hypothetical protein